MLDYWLKKLQFSLFPARCVLCGAPGQGQHDLCPDCRAGLPRNRHPCPICGQPGGLLSCTCHGHWPFERTIAPLLYRHPVDMLVLRLKFSRQLPIAPLLGTLLAEQVSASGLALPEAILPVPLHPSRLRERGFNQALEIARPLARQFALPLLDDHVRRLRPTVAQSTQNAQERQRNLRRAFVLDRPLPVRHIAIVDDVLTTGSTVSELATLLRRNGAESVQVWACARTPPPRTQ